MESNPDIRRRLLFLRSLPKKRLLDSDVDEKGEDNPNKENSVLMKKIYSCEEGVILTVLVSMPRCSQLIQWWIHLSVRVLGKDDTQTKYKEAPPP